jgi:hypothetical protein
MTTMEVVTSYFPLFMTAGAIIVGATVWASWVAFMMSRLVKASEHVEGLVAHHRHDKTGAVYYPAKGYPREELPTLAERPG